MLLEFARDQVAAFQRSYDADEVTQVASDWKSTSAALVAQCGLLVAVAKVPLISSHAQFRGPAVAIGLTLIGALLTLTAGRYRCRGPVGTAATLFDNAFWSAALGYAALNTQGGVAVALAIIQAVVLLGFTAQWYSLSLLLGLVLGVPTVGMLAAFSASDAVKVIMVATLVMALLMAGATGRRRALLERKRQLERALGASQRLAEDSMQVALSTTLLSLGHFLHELRNSQTAVSANLAYLELACKLDEAAGAALSEARQAQEAQGKLVRATIDELREKGRTRTKTFMLAGALRPFERHIHECEVTVQCDHRPIALTGCPEHFSLVLNNLIRNARQAGARRVCLQARMGPSGQSLHLLVHDDGPGIPRERRERLFVPFHESTNPEGSGLGLYLCRRYIELFGGTLTPQEGPLGGAAFLIQIPATTDAEPRPELDAAPVESSA